MQANLTSLGTLSVAQGQYHVARTLFNRSIEIARRNNDRVAVTIATNNLADLALNERDFAAARDLALEGARLSEELGDVEGRAVSLGNAGCAALHLGDIGNAAKLLSEALTAAMELGSREMVATCIDGFASIAARTGRADTAGRFLGAAAGLREEIGAIAERFERELHEGTMARVGELLDEQGVSKAILDGRSATSEEIVLEARLLEDVTCRES